ACGWLHRGRGEPGSEKVEDAASGHASFRGDRTGRSSSILRGLPGDEATRPGRGSPCRCYTNPTHGTFLPRCFQGPQYLVGRDGRFVDTYTHGIIDGVGDSRNDRVKRPLAGLLGAEGSFAVGNLYQDGFDFGCIQRRGEFIIQQGWDLVSPLAEDLLLH